PNAIAKKNNDTISVVGAVSQQRYNAALASSVARTTAKQRLLLTVTPLLLILCVWGCGAVPTSVDQSDPLTPKVRCLALCGAVGTGCGDSLFCDNDSVTFLYRLSLCRSRQESSFP